MKKEWSVAGHCDHECDGCFKGSKGCREPEDTGEGFVEVAVKTESDSNREKDGPGLLKTGDAQRQPEQRRCLESCKKCDWKSHLGPEGRALCARPGNMGSQ